MFYCQCLPLSYIVHQRRLIYLSASEMTYIVSSGALNSTHSRLIYLKKPSCSDNVVLQISAWRCFNDVRALCDIYHISVDTSLKRSVHYVKAIFVHHFITSFY